MRVTRNLRAVRQELSSCWDGRPCQNSGPKSGGYCTCRFPWGEQLGPHLTRCRLGQGLPLYQVASWSTQPFGHNTPTLQTDRKDRQRSDSIGRTVLQTVARKQKCTTTHRKTTVSLYHKRIDALDHCTWFTRAWCMEFRTRLYSFTQHRLHSLHCYADKGYMYTNKRTYIDLSSIIFARLLVAYS